MHAYMFIFLTQRGRSKGACKKILAFLAEVDANALNPPPPHKLLADISMYMFSKQEKPEMNDFE